MIRYTLKCTSDHRFESWFQSAEAFDRLQQSSMIACPACGDSEIRKELMAPNVKTAREPDASPEPPENETRADNTAMPHALSQPSSALEKGMKAFKKFVQDHSDYVGKDFATEARKIHLGEAPERSIYGEASVEDAKSLAEDGVQVAPLPFLPDRNAN